MLERSYTHLFFDWDGCLANTLGVWLEAYKDAFEHFNVKPTEKQIAIIFGSLHAIKEFGVEDVHAFNDYLVSRVPVKMDHVQLNDQVKETVLELRAKGKKMTIITSSKKGFIEHILKHNGIDQCFDFIVDRFDVKELKPDPEGIQIALKKFGASQEDALMIGDSDKDIGAGENAGIDTLLYYPAHNKILHADEYIETLKPTYTIAAFRELINIVR